MHSFSFGSRHETGNKLLDLEHQQLYQLVRECSSIADNGATCEYLMGKLHELYEKMARHFQNEERMMELFAPAQVEMHKKQHHDLLVWLKKSIDNFADRATRINAVQKILSDLLEWYEMHIQQEDRKLALQMESPSIKKKAPSKVTA